LTCFRKRPSSPAVQAIARLSCSFGGSLFGTGERTTRPWRTPSRNAFDRTVTVDLIVDGSYPCSDSAWYSAFRWAPVTCWSRRPPMCGTILVLTMLRY
jgi:hypothetical protein